VFKATVITSNKVLFEGDVWSVFLPGATGEIEVLELHKPILSLLRQGNVVINNGELKIPVKRGAMKVSGDELVAVVEE
jgi:F-type H+-transporting ATPase subunit epsilon